MKMMKKQLALFLCLFFLFGLAACAPSRQADNSPPPAKITVAATIFPLYDFTRQVGGERVAVVKVLPAGAEPHSWEPSPKDVAAVFGARLFVFNGAGMEPWAEKLKGELPRKGIRVVEASAGIASLPGGGHAGEREPAPGRAAGGAPPEKDPSGHRQDGEKETGDRPLPAGGEVGEHRHPPGAVDPHVWLDPVLAEAMVKKIASALIEIDPAGGDYYAGRAEEYCAKLRELDEAYRKALSGFAGRKIIVSHEAFGYLARRYGLEQIGVMGLAPESEPDPRRMKEIIEVCREHKVKYIFFEALVSPRLAEAVAREAGVRTLVLNPIGNLTPEQQAAGAGYLELMMENLENLKTALEGK
ncbi:MAG: zinc ABC transporter substrate-binding protein [Bacillota bacterium]